MLIAAAAAVLAAACLSAFSFWHQNLTDDEYAYLFTAKLLRHGHLTAPLRAAARAAGDAESINLWAGQAYELAEERPAAELVERWAAEAQAALRAALET